MHARTFQYFSKYVHNFGVQQVFSSSEQGNHMCRQKEVNMFPNLTTFEENIFISKGTFLLGKHTQA